MPSSAIGSGERSAWRAVPPTPTAHACTPLALRSPGHTWAAEGKATRTAARGGGEETGTRTSAQHGEGDRVGSARARVRAHRILPNFEQAQRGTECRRVANSRRGMSLPQADCRRGGGSTAAGITSLHLLPRSPHIASEQWARSSTARRRGAPSSCPLSETGPIQRSCGFARAPRPRARTATTTLHRNSKKRAETVCITRSVPHPH